jgi:excisionase family DNA binding protein
VPTKKQEFMTTEELAELLRTSRGNVHYWRHIGKGPPAVKVGRRVLFRRADVEAWLEDHESDPAERVG